MTSRSYVSCLSTTLICDLLSSSTPQTPDCWKKNSPGCVTELYFFTFANCFEWACSVILQCSLSTTFCIVLFVASHRPTEGMISAWSYFICWCWLANDSQQYRVWRNRTIVPPRRQVRGRISELRIHACGYVLRDHLCIRDVTSCDKRCLVMHRYATARMRLKRVKTASATWFSANNRHPSTDGESASVVIQNNMWNKRKHPRRACRNVYKKQFWCAELHGFGFGALEWLKTFHVFPLIYRLFHIMLGAFDISEQCHAVIH